jgi:hypothetical protein
MAGDNPVCEWGDCDREAEYKMFFTDPKERVPYCGTCLPAVKQEVEYTNIREV